MTRSPVPVFLDERLHQELEREAASRETTVEALADDAVSRFLDHQAWKREAIAKAVREADKGVFISEEAMSRWVLSWGTENELPPPEPDIFPAPSLTRGR